MNKERKPYEQALDIFRQELKMAILNEEIPMTFEPDTHPDYFADVTVDIQGTKFRMAVAETFICYLNNSFLENLFNPKAAEFKTFKTIVKKHVKDLTEDDKARIAELQAEIDRIKGK